MSTSCMSDVAEQHGGDILRTTKLIKAAFATVINFNLE